MRFNFVEARLVKMRILASSSLLFVAACGGSSQGLGSATFSGTVGGIALSAVDVESAAAAVPDCSSSGAYFFAGVVISDRGGVCGNLEADENSANATSLAIYIYSSAPIGAGVYSISTSGGTESAPATASFNKSDAACSSSPHQASAGTVTLTSVQGAVISGSFDLTFDGSAASHVTGTFRGAACGLSGADVCAYSSIPQPACH